jgi:hypothetical protein
VIEQGFFGCLLGVQTLQKVAFLSYANFEDGYKLFLVTNATNLSPTIYIFAQNSHISG